MGQRSFLCAVVLVLLSGCLAGRPPLERTAVQLQPVPARLAVPAAVYTDSGLACYGDEAQQLLAAAMERGVATHLQAEALRETALALDAEAEQLLAALNVERQVVDTSQRQHALDLASWRAISFGLGLTSFACAVAD